MVKAVEQQCRRKLKMTLKKAEAIFWCSKYKKLVDIGDCKWCRQCEPWKKDSFAKDYYMKE